MKNTNNLLIWTVPTFSKRAAGSNTKGKYPAGGITENAGYYHVTTAGNPTGGSNINKGVGGSPAASGIS